MRRLAIFLVLALYPVVPVHAASEIKLQVFVDSTDDELVQSIIGAAGETWMWANSRLRNEGKPAFYCQPKDLAIPQEEYVAMLKTFVRENPRLGDVTWQAYPSILLEALIRKFPC